MFVQTAFAALIVAACVVYAAWTLMPAAARRRIALAALKLPLPAPVAARMEKHSLAASGCGCDGCDHGTKGKAGGAGRAVDSAAPAVQPIRFHPRPPR